MLQNSFCIQGCGRVKADITPVEKGLYDVFLDVNSHKFYIQIHKTTSGYLDSFELVSSKSFMDVTYQSICTLRSLVEYVRDNSVI